MHHKLFALYFFHLLTIIIELYTFSDLFILFYYYNLNINFSATYLYVVVSNSQTI